MAEKSVVNIWYVCKYVTLPGEGAVGMRAFYLLSELVSMGWGVNIITSKSSELLSESVEDRATLRAQTASPSLRQLHVVRLPGKSIQSARSVSRILSWIEFEIRVLLTNKSNLSAPDVIIASSPSILSVISAWILSKRYRSKLVLEVRDIWPLTLTEEGGFSKSNPLIILLGLLERWSYGVSDMIIGTMPNLREHVETASPSSAEKVRCVPIGIPDDENDRYFQRGIAIKSDDETPITIGYVGTVGTTNALDVLLRAAEIIEARKSHVKFDIVGGGALLPVYQEKYSNLKNVKFYGPVPKHLVKEYIDEIDIAFFATFKSEVWRYGQSLNKIIDYMAAGKPILGSYSGFQSVINEADCGWFVEAENAQALADFIEELSTRSRKDLQIIGARGLEWLIRNRKYSTLAQNLDEFLTRLLGAHNVP